MKPASCSAAPRPKAETITPGRLPRPATTTIMNERTV
jgi:hypothetical protein